MEALLISMGLSIAVGIGFWSFNDMTDAEFSAGFIIFMALFWPLGLGLVFGQIMISLEDIPRKEKED